ncbi:MAG: hypothetical protein J6Y60_05360 [Treponema sp.]|nr:hypothetical protein [Treponema sp.]
MKITIYAKKRSTKEGKTFYNYLSKLTNKNGEEIPITVHFKMSAGMPNPDDCPCVIEFDKKNANLSKKERAYAKTDVVTGEVIEEHYIDNQLWLSDWNMIGEAEDHSLDDFD